MRTVETPSADASFTDTCWAISVSFIGPSSYAASAPVSELRRSRIEPGPGLACARLRSEGGPHGGPWRTAAHCPARAARRVRPVGAGARVGGLSRVPVDVARARVAPPGPRPQGVPRLGGPAQRVLRPH